MNKISKRKAPTSTSIVAGPRTLATVLAGVERPGGLSTTRRRDLRSAVKRVADLLGNEPGAIPLDLAVIGARLSTINPMAVGMTSKRFANVRSDFLAAMKASGLMAARAAPIRRLTAAWAQLFEHLSDRRAQIGLSRLARYASAEGIEPRDIDDRVIDQFIATVREGSLHRNPNTLHRQVTLIWNQVACDLKLGLNPVTIASFRGPPKRIVWSLLTQSFRRDVEDYLSWAERSDPFTAHKSSFLPMRIATISAPIRLANVGNYSLGVVMFDPERSN